MMKWGHFQPSHGARKCAYPILEMSQIIVDIQVFCQCCPFRKEELSAGIVTVVDSDVSLMVISVLGEMPSVLRFRSLWLRCWCKGGGGLYAPVFPATSTEGWVFLCVHAWKRTLGTFRRLQEVFFTDRGGATCDQDSRRPSSGPYSACFQSRTHFSMPTLDHVISLISFTLVF